MPSRHQKNVCQCNRQPFPSGLISLAIIFPKFSYARILPTRFITSATPQSPTPLALNARQNSLDTEPVEDNSSHIYNYYFVIVAVFVVIVFFLLLYVTRRRKRKAELLRNNGQSALARDVQSFADFRTRFGPRRGGPGLMGMTMGMVAHRETHEGLDERGEAPPAYVEGDKPPSLRSDDGISMMISHDERGNAIGTYDAPVVATEGNSNNTTGHDASGLGSRLSAEISRPTTTAASNSARRTSIGSSSTPITSVAESNQGVELRPWSRDTSTRPPLGPPTYSETYLGGEPDVTRPAAAVTVHDRFAPTRRLMSESRTSSET